jgi:hypothetical protein
MNRMLKGWRETRRGEQFGARIVNYADDFVILSRGKAKEAYFGRGSTAKAYRAVDQHVYDTVRHFLRRRHQVSSQGTRQFPEERVFGSLGVVRLPGPMGARS